MRAGCEPMGPNEPRFHRRAGGSSVNDIDSGLEGVADAALGDDEAGLRRIGFDLAAQPQNLHVYRAIVDLIVVYPAGLQQLVAGQNAVRGPEQCGEQVEFAVRELDGFAGRPA